MTDLKTDSLMRTAVRPDAVMDHGDGSYLYDRTGKRYLDFIQGWAVNALGHAPPEIQAALAAQSRKLLTPSPAFYSEPALALAERLTRLSGLAQVFFCNSGAEANEGAIKLARKWGKLHRQGAAEIITTEGGFHGRTLATMAASGKAGWDEMFPPRMPGFTKVPFGNVEAVERAITAGTVAIMVEPIQGEAGVVVPPEGYLGALRELTRRAGILLILDEVQTGIGRTGTLFAYEAAGIVPDILSLGKGLGAGVPLAALIATTEASCFVPGDQGGTYNGNPLMTAVGLAVLDTVAKPEFLENVRRTGAHLEAGLREFGRTAGAVDIRGRGLLWAVELREAVAERIRDACFEAGLLINAARPNVLRFMPSLRVSATEIDEMLGMLRAAIPRF